MTFSLPRILHNDISDASHYYIISFVSANYSSANAHVRERHISGCECEHDNWRDAPRHVWHVTNKRRKVVILSKHIVEKVSEMLSYYLGRNFLMYTHTLSLGSIAWLSHVQYSREKIHKQSLCYIYMYLKKLSVLTRKNRNSKQYKQYRNIKLQIPTCCQKFPRMKSRCYREQGWRRRVGPDW